VKVLVVGTGGALRGSGMTTMADQLARTLEDMGHSTTRLVAGDRRRSQPNQVNLENVRAALAEVVLLAKTARQTRPDVIWLHTFGVPALPAVRTLALVLGARAAGRPVFVHFHAFALSDQVRDGGWVTRAALRAVGSLSRGLIALHEDDAVALRSAARRADVVTVANWVDVPSAPVPMPHAPPFRAVFVGGLVARKGLPRLLAAMRLVEHLPLALRVVGGAGDEGEASAARIRAGAEDLVRDGRVSFLGEVDAAGVGAELDSAHLFVLPSEAEGMPRSLLEAMAHGRAVVVSAAANTGDIVRRHQCGRVLRDLDPHAIAQELTELLTGPDQLTDLGRRAHAAAVAELSPTAVRSTLEHILNSAASRR